MRNESKLLPRGNCRGAVYGVTVNDGRMCGGVDAAATPY